MSTIVILAAVGAANEGLGWRDVITALVGAGTLWVGITTARTGRKTNKDSIDAQAYTRADAINEAAFKRLEGEVLRLAARSDQLETKHAVELQERDDRIDGLEKRADKAERRVDNLLDYIRGLGQVPPPELP